MAADSSGIRERRGNARFRTGASAPPDENEGAQPSWWRRQWNRRWVRYAVFAGAGVIIILAALYWWNSRKYESTTDAFIDTHIVNVAPQVAGRINAVLVRDNDLVKKGQLLARIDPAQLIAQLNQAKAQIAQAQTQKAAAEAAMASAEAQAQNARTNASRYERLHRTAPAAIARQTLDQAVATARTAAAQLNAAQQKVASAAAQIKVAKAAEQAAALNVQYTEIRAPQAGHIAQRSVAVGDYVTAGEAMMALVPTPLWVSANFKETQLNLMKPGDPVSIAIDACGGRSVKGHVVSIQRGAGQAFQILPPQNATGNFVKVVQRVPVRIHLDSVPKGCVLGPGMSVEPTVTVR